jgi:hypothetical protein
MKTVISKLMAWFKFQMIEASRLPVKAHILIASLAMMASTKAMAAGGLAGFFVGWKAAGTALMDFMTLGGMVVGVCFVLYGLVNLGKKGMGRGDDIEWSKVIWPIVGGALASILMYVMLTVVETGGASKSDMGRSSGS